jgi:AAT family amino acid transporter
MAGASKAVEVREAVPVIAKPFGLELSSAPFALACFVVVYALSYAVWRLFLDPQLAVWKFYPQPFNVYLFWGILVVVFFGFNCGMAGFSSIKQPASGLLATAATIVLSFVIPGILIFGWGKFDPAFSATKFAGHGAAAMIVLIGFYGYGVLSGAMGGWPWADKLSQPLAGLAQIAVGSVLTLIGYLVLIYPSFASWTSPERVPIALPTAIGWFYSVIVCWLTTNDNTDNWPWIAFGSKAKVALATFFGNFVGGTVIYFVFLALLKNVLIPADALAKIGGAIDLWPAQLGVWIVNWGLFWLLCAGNVPNSFSPAVNRLLRFVITWGLGIASFVIYMRWFACSVLHEAAIVPGFGGDPLTWVDLLNYVLLIFTVYFGCYGLLRKAAKPAV